MSYKSQDEKRILSLIVVSCALFLDGILVSIVVPIFPEYLTTSINNETQSDGSIKDKTIHTTGSGSLTTLKGSSLQIGLIMAMKSIAQLCTNPFMGMIIKKSGCNIPLQTGFLVVLFASLILAIATSYEILLIARIIQGVGSSFLNVAGLSLLASKYTETKEREKSMTYALGGLSFGFLIGAPYAGVVYDLYGKSIVFLGVCLVAVVGGFSIFFAHFVLAFLETGLPIWLLDTLHLSSTFIGLAFLPCDIAFLLALKFYPYMMQKFKRWLTALLGILFMGISVAFLPKVKSFTDLFLPMAVLGIANGMAETSLMPELAHLVDIRHSAVYGDVYAIGDFAICASLGLGPIICGLIMEVTSFENIILGVAILYVLFTPCLFLLRNPPRLKEECQSLLSNC